MNRERKMKVLTPEQRLNQRMEGAESQQYVRHTRWFDTAVEARRHSLLQETKGYITSARLIGKRYRVLLKRRK